MWLVLCAGVRGEMLCAPKQKQLARCRAARFDDNAALREFYSEKDQYLDEFPVITNLINLMYMQALIWSGFPYSPALPALGPQPLVSRLGRSRVCAGVRIV